MSRAPVNISYLLIYKILYAPIKFYFSFSRGADHFIRSKIIFHFSQTYTHPTKRKRVVKNK